jgi:hypothetical protein
LINGENNSSFFLDVTYHHVSFDGADSATEFVTFSAGAVWAFSLFE